MFKSAPLSSGFMMVSLLGFVISAFFLDNKQLMSWAFAFMVVFVVMFIASIISISNAPIEEFSLNELGIEQDKKHKRIRIYPGDDKWVGQESRPKAR